MPGATPVEPPASQPPTSDQRNVSKNKKIEQNAGFQGVTGSSKLKLRKPLSRQARRIVKKKTEKLIRKRNELDEQLLREVQRKNVAPKDWLPRDKLLRRQTQLEKREERHIQRRTRKLAELERLYRWDPSPDRATDYDLVRYLLWKFKRHLGPLMDHHGKKGDIGEDASSSESESEDGWDDTSDEDEGDEKSGTARKNRTSKKSKKRKREESLNGSTSKEHKRPGSTSEGGALPTPTKGKKAKKDGKRNNTSSDQTKANLRQAGDD